MHTLTTLLSMLLFTAVAVVLPLGSGATTEADATPPPTPAERAFAKFKALEGVWAGTSPDGKSLKMSYQLTGDGSTVIEHFQIDGESDMFTAYHLDGDTILLTHYCAAGNQPRMRAESFPEDGEIRFELVDVTGLDAPTDGHMHRAVFEFESDDRFSTAWTWHENGQDVFTEAVEARRVAPR